MAKPVILCVDDQREVLAAINKDLSPFASHFELLQAEDAEEARDLIREASDAGRGVALVIADQVMPGQTGVEFLVALRAEERPPLSRKMLLTGLATHEDTIRAINDAKIDQYIAKPWQAESLQAAVRRLITGWVLDAYPDSYRKFMPVLDSDVLMDRLAERGAPSAL